MPPTDVLPQAWRRGSGYERSVYSTIINKTPLTARTNRLIGGQALSGHLQRLAKAAETSPEGVEQRIRTYLSDP